VTVPDDGPRLAATPETADEDPQLAQLMTTRVVAITADAPCSTALYLMAATGVRHLPVLDGNRCCGVVFEIDLARFASSARSPLLHATLCVGDLTRPAAPLPVTARRSDAARRMQEEHGDAVLVCDQGRLVGIVTATDLVHSLAATGREPGDEDPHEAG
jgi:signal-transduction protein with cAMP-binding, CBS, and nucleotidyltransferase domain